MGKKEKSKDYKVGGGKKWLVIFAVLALIAIAVVVILSVIPADTNKAVNLLKEVSATSYMRSDEEESAFNDFETKVETTSKLNNYIKKMPNEMEDVQNLCDTIYYVLNYYDDNMMFANKGNAFGKNCGAIMDGLNGAVKTQKLLNSIIDETSKLTTTSPTYLQNAWSEYRATFSKWLDYNRKAIVGLEKAYKGGMGNATNNNVASNIVLGVVSDYLTVISEDFKTLVNNDNIKPNASDYEYVSSAKIASFQEFVIMNVRYSDDIDDYYYDSEVKKEYNLLNKFYELYQEKDLTNVIETITYVSGKIKITKQYNEVTDLAKVYDKIKVFVVGG